MKKFNIFLFLGFFNLILAVAFPFTTVGITVISISAIFGWICVIIEAIEIVRKRLITVLKKLILNLSIRLILKQI